MNVVSKLASEADHFLEVHKSVRVLSRACDRVLMTVPPDRLPEDVRLLSLLTRKTDLMRSVFRKRSAIFLDVSLPSQPSNHLIIYPTNHTTNHLP